MEGWTAEQCAEFWGIKPGTWKGYVSRHQAPAAIGYDDHTGRRVWNPDDVTARRPGARRESE